MLVSVIHTFIIRGLWQFFTSVHLSAKGSSGNSASYRDDVSLHSFSSIRKERGVRGGDLKRPDEFMDELLQLN
ncbi:hypothetical protein NQZ68_029232 [Dissostichus eleginoides]|nr:hypothetical protein NQZ68_029232 [Dissostichus eleginoides]